MANLDYLIVVDQSNQRGVINAQQFEDTEDDRITIRLNDGRAVVLPKNVLIQKKDGTYTVPFNFTESQILADTVSLNESVAVTSEQTVENSDAFAVFPVIAETVSISKREVETGLVRITKTVHEEEAVVDEPLLREQVEVERRAVNRYVDGPVPVRYEGDTMIVSLVEEVLVIEKRLLVREELHITKRQMEERHAEVVTLRREETHVERLPIDDKSTNS